MPVNFPNSPSNDDEHSANGLIYKYNSAKGAWKRKFVAPTDATDINQLNDSSGLLTSSSTTVVADMAALIALTGMSSGDQAYITANNKLYFYNGSGWYLIATVQNNAPSAITGVTGAYALAIDGTATTITAVSTDPEGFPLTWSSSTSGLGSIATVSQVDNVFTITPSTTEADAGTFTLTINATDGINGAVNASTNLTLEFIVNIVNSNHTTLLATATGTSDNNNITDNSSNNAPLTNTGTPVAGTFSPYRSGGYSAYFTGVAGDKLTVSNQASNWSNTGTATIEFWFHSTRTPSTDDGDGLGAFWGGPSAVTAARFDIENTSNDLEFRSWSDQAGNGLQTVTIKSALTPNIWYHLAAVKNGQVWKFYIDGTLELTHTQSTTYNYTTSTETHVIGQTRNAVSFQGYITDVRVNSNEVYTAAFTAPTERLTADSNTTFFYNGTGYIGDTHSSTASNNESITVGGDVATKPFAPYDYTEYAAADNGGSVYFDGSSGASFSQINLSSTYTVECWFYTTSTDGYQTLFYTASPFNQFIARWTSSGVELQYYTKITHQTKTALNTWNHAALVSDGTDVYLYLNGERSTNSVSATTNSFSVNYLGWRSGEEFTGNIADARVTDGTAVYSGASFTPPAAPLSSSGADIHIKGTDASIIDKSQGSNLQLEGNTTGSTTQAKFSNTKSMYFDGSSDYLVVPTSSEINFGTADFTVEFWINFAAFPSNGYILNKEDSSGNDFTLQYYQNAIKTSNATVGSGWSHYSSGIGSLSTGTWYHIAYARSSGTLKSYKDGTQVNSATDSRNYNLNNAITLGSRYPGDYAANIYVQDFRITKGLARYTSNFSVPTESLKG